MEAQALKALQDDIYREKVARAQAMFASERLASVFECSDFGLQMMFGQIQATHTSYSEEQVWAEAGARIERVRDLCDRPIYDDSISKA